MTPALQSRVVEVHPELCFMEANAGVSMPNSKKKVMGCQQRVAVLQNAGFTAPLQLLGTPRPTGAKTDDLLDACIACWTAERVSLGVDIVVPTTSPTDSRGLRMELRR
jgi:predicted RNase H-like nuclease